MYQLRETLFLRRIQFWNILKKVALKPTIKSKQKIKSILDGILADILGEIVSTRSRYELTVGIFDWNLRSEGEMFALRFLFW